MIHYEVDADNIGVLTLDTPDQHLYIVCEWGVRLNAVLNGDHICQRNAG